MSVSISEILAGAEVHAVPLAGECAGYLVLAAADQAVVAPRRIAPGEVHLEGDGSVRVDGARAADEADSEGDLRALLDALLLNASSATPALLRASRRAPGRGIAALVREIETALIPVNRAAAHRALARLERETARARKQGRLDRTPTELPRRSEPLRTPAPVFVAASPTPPPPVAAVEPRVEPPPPVEAEPEIPSLLAPPVEAIAEYASEIETRPEPIVVRRSAKPPPLPRTPSPPAPSVEAQRATPFFGTVVVAASEEEMEIEVVVDDDELIDDELTGVLPRATPLEVSAMAPVSAAPEPTEPCPPATEEEASDTERTAAPPVFENSEHEDDAMAEAVIAEAAELPPAEPSEPESTIVLAEVAEIPPPEAHGETVALALGIEPVVPEPPPAVRLPMPKPRPSDVDDLLGRMTQAALDGSDDVRSSLKSLAGLEPTPLPPPET